MTESGETYPPPPSLPPSFPPAPAGRSSMVLRHVIGTAVALVLTPIGLLVFDYGSGRYLQERLRTFDESVGAGPLALMIVGLLILAVVAVSARLSGLGPLLAGLVWGGLPFLWVLLDLSSFLRMARDLPGTYFWFSVPTYLFPLVGALLVGAGVAGRWRGRPQHRLT